MVCCFNRSWRRTHDHLLYTSTGHSLVSNYGVLHCCKFFSVFLFSEILRKIERSRLSAMFQHSGQIAYCSCPWMFHAMQPRRGCLTKIMNRSYFCLSFLVKRNTVEIIQKVPIQSYIKKGVFNQITERRTTTSGSTDTIKLVFCPPIFLVALKYE